MNKLLIFSLLIAIASSSCRKEEVISSTPKITWESYGPNKIKELKDSVFFSINYEDFEGDIGSPDPLVKNLFITDNRFGFSYKMRIPELVPKGQEAPIKGNINFSINNTVRKGLGSEEEVIYTIYIVDRAGHLSNSIQTVGLKIVE